MTTTITVKARAWGAKVEVNGNTQELGPNEEHSFHVSEGEEATFKVTHGEQPKNDAQPVDTDNVPGRAENDALLRKTPDNSKNETGADETAQTTEGTPSRKTR